MLVFLHGEFFDDALYSAHLVVAIPNREAAVEAGKKRLRPILMTTFAMVFGAVPLAYSSGAGAETREQIGLVIVGGMSFGTLFTLFVIPVVYTYLSRKAPPPSS